MQIRSLCKRLPSLFDGPTTSNRLCAVARRARGNNDFGGASLTGMGRHLAVNADPDRVRSPAHLGRRGTRPWTTTLATAANCASPRPHKKCFVELPSATVAALKVWKLACAKGKLELVFPRSEGGQVHHFNFRGREFIAALRRAGLRRMGVHNMRHTSASLLIAAGCEVTIHNRKRPNVRARLHAPDTRCRVTTPQDRLR
jgi:hypothetical protein